MGEIKFAAMHAVDKIPIRRSRRGKLERSTSGVAARHGEMDAQVSHVRIGELVLDRVFEVCALDQFPTGHHPTSASPALRR